VLQDPKRRVALIENSTITTKITTTKTETTETIIERIMSDPTTMIEESNNKPPLKT
jgi:hypothetical protein